MRDIVVAIVLATTICAAGCGDVSNAKRKNGHPASNSSERLDWNAVRASKVLRVLKPPATDAGISSSLSDAELADALLRNFAAKYGLRLVFIHLNRPERIISALRKGEGDLAVNGVSMTPYLKSFLIETRRIPSSANGKGLDPWLLPKGSGLLKPLNAFIQEFAETYDPNNFTGDLPALRKRRYIKVLTRNNPVCYFIHRGESMGFEYELAARFAKTQGLQIIVIVPPKWSDLIPWLKAGKGDLIAVAMTPTKRRKGIKGITFCKPYAFTRQMVVARKNERRIRTTADLAGRTFTVRKNSSYWETLSALQRSGVALKLEAAPQTMETDEIIEGVADGSCDLTLADDPFVRTSDAAKRLSTPLSLGSRQPYAWVVRSNNPILKKAVDAFVAKEYRGAFYNILRKKHFGRHSKRGGSKFAHSAKNSKRFSPYDDLVKKHAAACRLPWCLIVAQMRQESRFDPKAKSWAGTIGLMQLTPATAREMNCRDIRDPEENIKAGVRYLKKLEARLPESVKGKSRYCFALAGYNGGYGHLIDARPKFFTF